MMKNRTEKCEITLTIKIGESIKQFIQESEIEGEKDPITLADRIEGFCEMITRELAERKAVSANLKSDIKKVTVYNN